MALPQNCRNRIVSSPEPIFGTEARTAMENLLLVDSLQKHEDAQRAIWRGRDALISVAPRGSRTIRAFAVKRYYTDGGKHA
jgi:hypothetical protein